MYNQPQRHDDDDLNEVLGQLEREVPRFSPPEREHSMAQRVPVPPGMPQQSAVPRVRVVTVLLVINVAMFVLTNLLVGRVQTPYGSGFTGVLYLFGAKDNLAIDAGQWWRLLTPMVLHGNLMHLLFNSYALYVLGTGVEESYGARRFLAIYLLAGLAGSMASYIFNPGRLSVGASGAIFGLMGAMTARILAARSVMSRESSKMQLGQIASLVALNLFFGFTVPSIDNAAHIGGLLFGALIGLVLAPRYQIVHNYGMPFVQRRNSGQIGWLLVAGMGMMLVGIFVFVQSAL